MGIFYEQRTVVNRAPIALKARFDGQDTILPPGESLLPAIAIDRAKDQNPIMGSADPNNPHMSGGRYLIGVKGVDNCTPLTKEEWEDHLGRPCRMDWEALMEDRISPGEKVVFKGKDKRLQAKSAFDAGVRVRTPETHSDTSA